MAVRSVVRNFPVLAAIATACAWLGAIDPAAQAQEIAHFDRDIQPIFARHCWKCHGETQALGGLRLDQKRFAQRGGGSGKNLLTVGREGNELLRRVRSTVPEERMPPEGPPLTDEEIATLDRWIYQGAHWPDHKPAPEPPRSGQPEPDTLLAWLDRWDYVASAPFRPVYFTAIGLLLVMLVIERVKNHRLTTAGRSSRLMRRVARLPRVWYLVGLLALVCFWLVQLVRDQNSRVTIQQLSASSLANNSSSELYRSAHHPYRPLHPPRLGGEYYRGNDERGEELYNGGFYRTATFRVQLTDDAGNQLAWGDDIPERLNIRYEIHRSPHSSPSLFADSIMDNVFLSAVQPEQLAKASDVAPTPMIPLTPGEHWSCLYPLGPLAPQGRLTGLIYIYKGHDADKARRSGDASYLIGYEIIAAEGKIARQSQIWMASVYNVNTLQWPEPGQIPADHWFDFRPIPEIEK